jgi:SynChlorMet cassette radical SAM/SPASM protein ScmF
MEMPLNGLNDTQNSRISYHSLDLPDGVPQLTSLYLYIAGSCNLACRHCWISPKYIPNNKGGEFLRLEYLDKAIREALPLGLKSVKLTGGEPTLHPRFHEFVTFLDQVGLDISMETNGTLIDENLAHFIKSKPHFSFISVSLDGADRETHEALRMVPGSYEKTLFGIKNLVNIGIHPQLICTLHEGNIGQIAEFIGLANNLKVGSVKFNHVQGNGRGEEFAKAEGLSIVELIETSKFIENEIIPSSKIPVFFDIPIAFRSPRIIVGKTIGQCNALNIMGVLANGDLSLCGIGVTVNELIYGNLGQHNLAEVWCNAPGLINLRTLIPGKFEGICGDCIHSNFCLGSCIAGNYHDTGFLNKSYYFCTQAEDLNLFPQNRRRNLINRT